MYLAELHGKLSSKLEGMEDLLTSNVFSFLKYSTREIFLKGYLAELGFAISDQEANDAEFIFWPRYEDKTEPDLVIIAGDYYLLIEAKYFSGFSEETSETKAQLVREIENGKLEARNYGKEFRLIAITADHYYKREIFEILKSYPMRDFMWTNWQRVAAFLDKALANAKNIRNQDQDFALDLYALLDKKKLRDFQGFDSLCEKGFNFNSPKFLFFEANTADFRGAFIGFTDSLLFDSQLTPSPDNLFWSGQKIRFSHLFQFKTLRKPQTPIFFKEGQKYDR
jgi:hypothetical protein